MAGALLALLMPSREVIDLLPEKAGLVGDAGPEIMKRPCLDLSRDTISC
jgi:hypothetical protein